MSEGTETNSDRKMRPAKALWRGERRGAIGGQPQGRREPSRELIARQSLGARC